MTKFEKIKAMDIDSVARLIASANEYDGFMDKACRKCPMNCGDKCRSKDIGTDCMIAARTYLNTEAEE